MGGRDYDGQKKSTAVAVLGGWLSLFVLTQGIEP